MMAVQKDRYGWVKTALMEAGLEQKDVAKAWGVGQAPVSRWIKTGEPTLSLERAEVTAKLLDMSLDEFRARLAGHVPPRVGAIAKLVAKREHPAPPTTPPAAPPPGGILGAVKEMEEAAARAHAMLPPGLKVVFSIEKE